MSTTAVPASALATSSDSERLEPPGWLAALGLPFVALAAAGFIALAGSNERLFRVVNSWPLATGDTLWWNLGVLGEGVILLALSVVLIPRRPALLRAFAVCLVLGLILLHPLKDLSDVARPRRVLGEEAVHVIGPALNKRSFPSGHALTAFAAAGLLFAATRTGWARATALILATLIALSRLAAGAHWPIDVLAGAALGWLCAAAAVHIVGHWRWGTTPRGRLIIAALPIAAALEILVMLPAATTPELARPLIALAALFVGVPAWLRLRRAGAGSLPARRVRTP